MLIAGIGCRRGVTGRDVETAVTSALGQLAEAHRDGPRPELSALATWDLKGGEAGLTAAARSLRLPLALISAERLREAAPGIETPSRRVEALTGLPSVAEAAALAAAGPGARIVVARIVSGPVTCAIAETAGLSEAHTAAQAAMMPGPRDA